MIKEESTKFVNFMTPGAGVLMLGRGHISHYSEYVVSSTQYTSHWFLLHVLMYYDADSYTIIDLRLFYDGAVDIHISSLLSTWYILIPCLLDSGRFCFYRKDKPEFCTMGAHMFLKHSLLGVADITQYLQCMGKCNFPRL